MTATDKNIKCTSDELKRFDGIMLNEPITPKSRHELLTRMMDVYVKHGASNADVKEVPAKKAIKKKILAALDWLDSNTLFVPTYHNNKVKSKRDEIRDSIKSL